MLGCAVITVFALLFPLQSGGKKSASIPKLPTKVYLKSGHSFQGQVLSEDETTIKLAVSYGHLMLRKDEIKEIVRGEGMQVIHAAPILDGAAASDEKPKQPIGFKLPPSLTEEEKAAMRVTRPAVAESAAPRGSAPKVVHGFLGHFLWFLPDGDDGKFLCGSIFFLGFFLLFFFASKLAGIEDLSFGKALGFCVPFFLALSLQVHFDAHSVGIVVVYALADLLLWFALVKLVLKEPAFRGAGMLALFVFAGLLGVLASQLSFVILNQELT